MNFIASKGIASTGAGLRRASLAAALLLALAPAARAQGACDYEAEFRRATGQSYAAWQAECRKTCGAEIKAGVRTCTALERVRDPACPPDPCAKCASKPLVPGPGETVTDYMRRCGKVIRGVR